jgi:hypothetical protein
MHQVVDTISSNRLDNIGTDSLQQHGHDPPVVRKKSGISESIRAKLGARERNAGGKERESYKKLGWLPLSQRNDRRFRA